MSILQGIQDCGLPFARSWGHRFYVWQRGPELASSCACGENTGRGISSTWRAPEPDSPSPRVKSLLGSNGRRATGEFQGVSGNPPAWVGLVGTGFGVEPALVEGEWETAPEHQAGSKPQGGS